MANKLYQENAIQDIAAAIREKNGSSATYKVADMGAAVRAIQGGNADIPSYHYAEALRVAEKISDFKKAHPNNIIFGAISDIHVYANDATYEAKSKTAIKNAAFALETVGAMVGADFIANLGDNCWENGIDTDNALEGARYSINTLKPAFERLERFSLVGNHDRSGTTQKQYDLISVWNEFDAWGTDDGGNTGKIRGFGYKDFADKKVRVICLNTTDYLNVTGGCALSYNQKDFLIRALNLSEKSDAADWQILLLSHIPLDWNGGDYDFYADLQTILTQYEKGGKVAIAYNPNYAVNESVSSLPCYTSGGLTYDFNGKNLAKVIANIHGHIHTNKVGKLANTNFARVATANTNPDLNKSESYAEYGDYSISSTEASKIVKVQGTAKDTSATFYCIDLDEQTIYAYGYGADIDRTIIYKDATKYSVTYNLTNVTSSNIASEVAEGSSFTAALTAASGYALDAVTVTMGGQSVTVTNGVINIANVTGNIVITATAKAVTSYTNVIDTVGTVDKMRIRSNGAIGDGAGFVSGVFPAKAGDIIRVSFPNGAVSSIPSNGSYCATYSDAAGNTYIEGFAAGSTYIKNTGTNYYEIHIPASGNNRAQIAYARVAGGPAGAYAGWIVTVNEEIK